MPEELSRLWRGELPLRRTYWLYWFCVAFPLGFVRGFLESYYPWFEVFEGPGMPSGDVVALYFLAFLASWAWAAFMIVPLWRSASGYEGRQVWAILVRLVAISNAIGVVIFAYYFCRGFIEGFTQAISYGAGGVEII